MTQKQKKLHVFRIRFFASFDFRPGGSNGDSGGVTVGGYKTKLTKGFFRSIPATFCPWAMPETVCGTAQSSCGVREDNFSHIPDFRPEGCTRVLGAGRST